MNRIILNLFFLSLLTFLNVSCLDEVDNKGELFDKTSIKSFGFYMEDNPILTKDIIVDVKNNKELRVPLPSYVDRSKLVVRYNLLDESADIILNDELQTSGVSVVDFTNPVDLFIKLGNETNRYSITVVDAPLEWKRLLPFSIADSKITDFQMKINPINGCPYVLFVNKASESKLTMVSYKDDKWDYIGSSSGFTDGDTNSKDFDFDSKGNPYVAYCDRTIDRKLSVMCYENGEWKSLGKGITSSRIDHVGISLTEKDEPMVLSLVAAAGGGLPRNELNVSTYINGLWLSDQTIPVRDAGSKRAWYNQGKLYNGINYWATFDFGSKEGFFSVYSYDNKGWKVVDEDVKIENAVANSRAFAMNLDSNGNIYAVIADDETGDARIRVLVYNLELKEWKTVVSPTEAIVDRANVFSFALSSEDVPYLLYKDKMNSFYPTVISVNEATKKWYDPLVLDQFEVDQCYIDFTKIYRKGYALYNNPKGELVLQELSYEN
ncbi:MAG: hypothetical protein GX367_09210 [Bacteroidales bacterium]|nr:hypothetical protein [Bacteroidales bacterium]